MKPYLHIGKMYVLSAVFMGFFLYNAAAETRVNEPDIEILGLLKTFHNLAIMDANAAMDV